jgi:hypothetical protein
MNNWECVVKLFFYLRLNTGVCPTAADWHRGDRSCVWETGGLPGWVGRGGWNQSKWEGPVPTDAM